MLRSLCLTAFALVTVLSATAPKAAPDLETAALPDAEMEIVVVEAEGCVYCEIFRRDVLPSYRLSPRGRQMPLRFLDINEVEERRLPLAAPVAMVPTAVLLKDHQEVGRIEGYVGPEAFFHSVNRLLSRAD